MAKGITWIGMDAHKKFISVAMLLPRRKTTEEWKVNNEPKALKRLVRKLEREAPGEIRCCYEAGVCGFALQRTLQALSKGRLVCEVIAPALVPRKAGERIKTDRRDARKLAELFRACLLTEVHPPQADDEAVRDLCRCREDAQEDLMRARHRLSKWLLRRGLSFTGTKNWSLAHRHWLKGLSFEHEADAATFHDYLRSMEQIEERLKDLMENIERMAVTESYAEAVGLLRCFRGIDTLTAMTIVAELHDFGRFESPRALMSYLGLVPGEHSSGGKSRRGPITKTGNRHVRRIVVEASKHYRKKPTVGPRLKKRRTGQPADVVRHADKAQSRLHRKYWRLVHGNKNVNKATIAVARELVGFLWAVLYPRSAQVGPGLRRAA